MGNSAAPKTFAPATPFGQSPQAPIATETQPLATVTGPGMPAYSGYNMTPGTPQPAVPSDPGGGFGGGDIQALKDQMQARRTGNGGVRMPFYG